MWQSLPILYGVISDDCLDFRPGFNVHYASLRFSPIKTENIREKKVFIPQSSMLIGGRPRDNGNQTQMHLIIVRLNLTKVAQQNPNFIFYCFLLFFFLFIFGVSKNTISFDTTHRMCVCVCVFFVIGFFRFIRFFLHRNRILLNCDVRAMPQMAKNIQKLTHTQTHHTWWCPHQSVNILYL